MSEGNRRRIVELKDDNGIIFPQTHLNAVIDSNYRPLNEILEDIQAGEANLSGIREAISELQEAIFPLTASIIPNKTVYEYSGNDIEGSFNYSISFRGDTITKEEISELNLAVSEGISGFGEISKESSVIPFRLNRPDNFSGFKSYNSTISVKLTNGRSTSASCSFSQQAPVWIGWSEFSEISGSWLKDSVLNSLPEMRKVLKTDLSGSYDWKSIPINHCFWIIVPESNNFSGYNTIIGNNFPVTVVDKGIFTIRNINYRCIRNASGPVLIENTSWAIKLSN